MVNLSDSPSAAAPRSAVVTGIKIVVALGVIIGAVVAVWAWRGIYTPVQNIEMALNFSVEEGSGVQTIAADLEEAGLIRSTFLFGVYVRMTDQAAGLQAGEYSIATNATVPEIVEQLTGGETVEDVVVVRIIEGWRADKMLPALQEAGLVITETEWEAAIASPSIETTVSELYEGKSMDSWEGYLFPDTYHFAPQATATEVVQKMVSTFEKKVSAALPNFAERAATHDLTAYEAVVLASIIEREVIDTDEREIASGIFLQRIEDNYPLQSDATVEYVTKAERVETTFAETKIESPWNTYTNTGLPPTPISSPSINAIESVLNAQPSNYYFFLTTLEGDAIFSETYEEHLVNKSRYLD